MALLLEGSEYISFSGWPIPNGVTGIVSISWWFKPTSIATSLQRHWGSASYMEARMSTAGILTNDIFETTGDYNSSITFVDDTIYHVVMTGDANTDTVEIYVDGSFDASWTDATGNDSGTTLSIGNRTAASAAQSFYGIIDDWRSYDRVLTAAEISTIYACRGIDEIVNGLTCRFTFNDGAPGTTVSGSTLTDLSNTGVTVSSITGTPTFAESLGLSFRRRV